MQPSVSTADVARFDRLAAQWWNPRGPMRPLHAMNRLRTRWIGQRLGPTPVRLLDVGCGAGIASEALARMGHPVLGIDAAPQTIAAAQAHAEGSGLALAYRAATPEDLMSEGVEPFAAIMALEVIEHVSDPSAFLRSLAALLAPGGKLFVSTLNRTARSFVVAIVGAEYIAGLLPQGTHDWRRFVTPGELSGHLHRSGLRLADIEGMSPDLLRGGWRSSRDLAVNYIAMAAR